MITRATASDRRFATDRPYIPERRRPRNRFIVVGLLVLGSLLTSVALLAAWAQFQLLNTERFSDTAIEMLEDEDVRAAVADYLIDAVGGDQISEAQRERLRPEVRRALLSDASRRAWRAAVTDAHVQLVDLVEGGSTDASTLDLARLVRVTAREIDLPLNLDGVSADDYRIEIVNSQQLRADRTTADDLDRVANVLFIVTPLVLALAVVLASNRRRLALAGAAIAVAVGAAVVLIARSLIGDHVVGELVSDPAANDAAHSVWSIGTSWLATLAVVLLVGAAIVVAIAAFAQPPQPNPLGPGRRNR